MYTAPRRLVLCSNIIKLALHRRFGLQTESAPKIIVTISLVSLQRSSKH